MEVEPLEDRTLLANVSLSVDLSTGTESGETVVTITATADFISVLGDTVDLAVTGTGIDVGDYSLSSSTITIPALQTTGSVTFTIQNDTLLEGLETATVSITDTSLGLTPVAPTSVDIAINDDESATLDIAASGSGVESGGGQTVDVQLSISGSGTGTFALATGITLTADVVDAGSGSANTVTDFTAFGTQTVTFNPGDASGTIQSVTLTPIDDAIVEADETVDLTLQNLGNLSGVSAVLGNTASTQTITNDDTSTLTIDGPSVVETDVGTTLTFTVTSPNAVDGGFTVDFSVADITALLGTDYTVAASSPLTFTGTAGETQDLVINIIGDTIVEVDETFSVTLGTITAAVIDEADVITGDSGTGTITNDDTSALTINSPSVLETDVGTTLTFTVTSPNEVDGGFTVDFGVADITALLGTDYTLVTSSPLTFTGTPGETQDIVINIVGDTVVEADETFSVTLGTITAAVINEADVITGDSGTGTIVNDDTSTLTINSPSVLETDVGTTLIFTITSSNAVNGGFILDFSAADLTATLGSDYTLSTSSPLGFDGIAGETQDIVINIVGDTIVEGDETFTVTLGAVSDAFVDDADIITGDIGTGTTTNDDTTTLTISSPSGGEGDAGTTSLTFIVTSSNAVQGGFTVAFSAADVTATLGSDYTGFTASPLTFAGTVGEQQNIIVNVIGDTDLETNEVLEVTLGTVTPVAPVDAADIISGAVGTGTIVENDIDLAVTKTDGVTSVVAGLTTTYTITVTNNGLIAAPGTTLVDTFPAAITSATWTSSASPGASGNTAVSSGNISETLSLAPGASVTYTVIATVSPSATGNLDNTATAGPGAGISDSVTGNDNATDSDLLLSVSDLQVSVSDGLSNALPGSNITYTIVVSNIGSNAVAQVQVVDTFPSSLTGVNYTAVGVGGASGFSSRGINKIFENPNTTGGLTLPAGSNVTYTVKATVKPSATGTLVNTATATGPVGFTDTNPNNNSQTDTDPLTPNSDVWVSITDNTNTANAGSTVTYKIVVSNKGPSDATGAALTYLLPAAFTGATWTSMASSGASGNSPSGSGGINEVLSLASGAKVTYTVVATLSASASGNVTSTVTVTPGSGVTEPVTSNNTASDLDTIQAVRSFTIQNLDTENPTTKNKNKNKGGR